MAYAPFEFWLKKYRYFQIILTTFDNKNFEKISELLDNYKKSEMYFYEKRILQSYDFRGFCSLHTNKTTTKMDKLSC